MLIFNYCKNKTFKERDRKHKLPYRLKLAIKFHCSGIMWHKQFIKVNPPPPLPLFDYGGGLDGQNWWKFPLMPFHLSQTFHNTLRWYGDMVTILTNSNSSLCSKVNIWNRVHTATDTQYSSIMWNSFMELTQSVEHGEPYQLKQSKSHNSTKKENLEDALSASISNTQSPHLLCFGGYIYLLTSYIYLLTSFSSICQTQKESRRVWKYLATTWKPYLCEENIFTLPADHYFAHEM